MTACFACSRDSDSELHLLSQPTHQDACETILPPVRFGCFSCRSTDRDFCQCQRRVNFAHHLSQREGRSSWTKSGYYPFIPYQHLHAHAYRTIRMRRKLHTKLASRRGMRHFWVTAYSFTNEFFLLTFVVEARSPRDLVFWDFYAQPTCNRVPLVCPVPVQSLRVARTLQDNCSMVSLGLYRTNACFLVITLGDGTWYFINDCNPNTAWINGTPGAYVGTLLTYGDKPIGKCYYATHVRKFPSCPGFDQVFLTVLVRCSVP